MAQDKKRMKRAKVIEIKASGVIVQLENGEDAWIPGQEFSTKYNPSKPLFKQGLGSEGEELEVIEYGREVGGERKLFSHIRVQNDPWDKVKEWKDNDVKEMEIHSVTPTRAFGKISPGIEGYFELSDLNNYLHFPSSWRHFKKITAGDIIAGYVDTKKIDNKKRLVKLDVTSYIKNLQDISEALPVLKRYPRSMLIDVNEDSEVKNKKDWLLSALPEVKHIFLVDDSEVFLEEISAYLSSSGIKVAATKSKDEAEKILSSMEFPDIDIALIDVHLTGTDDYEGIEVAKKIIEKQPRCRIIITTGADFVEKKMIDAVGNISISFFLYKPFGIEELSHAISVAIREKPKGIKNFFSVEEEQKEIQSSMEIKTQPFISVINTLTEEVGADTIILFSIHPISFEVSIVAYFGRLRERVEENLTKLRYSPIKDVAIDREEIFEKNASSITSYPKHRWLYKALLYESCIAFPVDVTHEFAFSLFAFHKNRNMFKEKHKKRVKTAAKEIAHILEIQQLQDIWRSVMPFILVGKTYGSMAHDLLSALSREFSVPAILKILENKSTIREEDIEKIKRHLEGLRKESERAKGIVETFRRMSASHHEVETVVDVYDVITEVSRNIKIEADALNSKISVALISEEMKRKVNIRKSALEQVIYNLILNAAQQIDRFSFIRNRGYIRIELDNIESEDEHWIRILIHDTGPGIHAHNFERVFQAGYTTKEDGCGMGLDICRSIVEETGGKIRVLKSVLFVGTTFEILLPLDIKEV